MKKLTDLAVVAIVVTVALVPTLTAQNSAVRATLVVPDTTLLPGVPFEGWVNIENTSDGTVVMGLAPSLRVTDISGHPIDGAQTDDILVPAKTWGERPSYYLQLASGERRTLLLPIGEFLSSTELFSDERISDPGRYTIALRLDAWQKTLMPRPPAGFVGPVVTNSVTIERSEPSGADAEVWRRLKEIGEGRWSPKYWDANAAVASEILNQHRESAYGPYALVAASFGNTHRDYLDVLLDNIQRFPKSPVVELLRINAAGLARTFTLLEIEERQMAAVKQSVRPTTRRRAFPGEQVPNAQ